MAEGKIEISVGAISFKGEGSEAWLTSQLDKMLKHLPELANAAPEPYQGRDEKEEEHNKPANNKARGTLAAFLTAKNAKSSQPKKFLATAIWLHDGGKNRLATGDVTKAIGDASQGSLTNPAQCLIRNVKKGYCDREGDLFYVTPEGRTEIG